MSTRKDHPLWPLLWDVAAEAEERGDAEYGSLDRLGSAAVSELLEDHIAPAVKAAEKQLRQIASCEPGSRSDGARVVELPRDVDTAALEAACHDAGLPHYVHGFVEAVARRGKVEASFLNTLTTIDLEDLADLLEAELAGVPDALANEEEGVTDLAA